MTLSMAIVLLVCAIIVMGTAVLMSLIVLKTIPRAFNSLDRMQARHEEHMDKLLDRLMTIKWEDYVALQDTQIPEDGGFFAPGELDEPGEVEVQEPGLWGTLRRRSPLDDADETALLEEDFPRETV